MTVMESRFCQQANPYAVEGRSMNDDGLSTTPGPPLDENERLGNAETSSANGLHETPLASFVPPLVDIVSRLDDDQSQNTPDNESNVEETGEYLTNAGFFPSFSTQATARSALQTGYRLCRSQPDNLVLLYQYFRVH